MKEFSVQCGDRLSERLIEPGPELCLSEEKLGKAKSYFS